MHVFFNRVFKVLDKPFTGRSLLVTRCSNVGPNLVYRDEVGTVLPLLDPVGRIGVIQLRAAARERYGPDEAFDGAPVSHLDLVPWIEGIYPPDDVPTSGFALASWLADMSPRPQVELHGFSARRSDRWKLFDTHDWTFERIALAVLESRGLIEVATNGREEWPLNAFLSRYGAGGASPEIIAGVLSDRLRGTNVLLDRVWSMLKPVRYVDGLFRRLKPKNRRQRMLAAEGRSANDPSVDGT